MKLYIILIFTTISTAFVAGHYTLFLKGNHQATAADMVAISQIKYAFQRQVRPLEMLDLEATYPREQQWELLDPMMQLPQEWFMPQKNIDYSHSDDCQNNFSDRFLPFTFVYMEKALIWEDFRCGRRLDLPAHFFFSPPFVHPSGKSYSYLAWKTDKNPFITASWLTSHLSTFHVSELSPLQDQLKTNAEGLKSPYRYLINLQNSVLRALADGESTILIQNKYLLLRGDRDLYGQDFVDPASWKYAIYSLNQLQRFIPHSPFTNYVVGQQQKGESCLLQDGGMCWNYSVRHLLQLAGHSTLLLIIGSIFTLMLVVWIMLSKLRGQKLEDERKRLALQVLTHEFRTPITSMLLEMENMHKYYDDLPEDMQESFMRLSSDVYRLQRLTEKSRDYLRVQAQQGQHQLIAANPALIPSINEYINEVLGPYLAQMQWTPLPAQEDSSFYLDPYWVGICIKNLVENAIHHGAAPLQVQLHWADTGNGAGRSRGGGGSRISGGSSGRGRRRLCISIIDQGHCPFQKLEDMTPAFIKGGQSQGSGLGLNIVKSIAQSLGATLLFTSHPTTFTLTLNSLGEEKNDHKTAGPT